jgi:hypothetical protein
MLFVATEWCLCRFLVWVGGLSMSVAGILPERNVGEYPLPDWQDASGAQHTHKGVRFLTCNVA